MRLPAVTLIAALSLMYSGLAHAQNEAAAMPDAPQPQSQNPLAANADKDKVTLRATPLNILKDQEAVWTSPARIRDRDLAYLVPLVGFVVIALYSFYGSAVKEMAVG